MKGIILFGCPRPVGGGNTESAAVALLWRSMGISVTVIPASKEAADNHWPARLAEAGCKITKPCPPNRPPEWLKDSIVVDFAVERCVRLWPELRRRNCKLIHLPCMCFAFSHETAAFRNCAPSAVVFQSQFQKRQVGLQYGLWGVDEARQHIIHGAFDGEDFPFQPRGPGKPFIVGTIGRDVGCKWPRWLVSVLGAVRERTPTEGLWLGWTNAMEHFSGPLPSWIIAHRPGSVPVPTVLSRCHALLALPDCLENWPRITLEAMSSGVPIVAWNRGGFAEHLQNGETALLVDNEQEAADALVRLATDEILRQRLIANGRKAIKTLANPAIIGRQWKQLFGSLQERKTVDGESKRTTIKTVPDSPICPLRAASF